MSPEEYWNGLAPEPEDEDEALQLEDHINGYIGEGPLTDETRAFKIRIIERMKAQGWRVSRGSSGRWQVLPPREEK